MRWTLPQPLSAGAFPGWICLPQEHADAGALPVTYVAAGPDFVAALPECLAALQAAGAALEPFALVAFASEDWNRDYTPWPTPPLFRRDTAFAGGARDTLGWLTGALLPAMEAAYPVTREASGRSLMGYSLGGLFSLWACCETDAFGACASCSGSLWYDDFDAYLQAHPLQSGRVYLSLGDREAGGRNPRMARVGAATRAALSRFQAQPGVAAAFASQPGGHFDGVQTRIADALAWLHRKHSAEKA